MPRLHANDKGNILRFTASRDADAKYADSPPGTVSTLDFDADSNATLVADLSKTTEPYKLLAGVLTKDGFTVPIAPDAPDGYKQAVVALDAMQADIAAATTVAQLKPILQKQRIILRRLIDYVALPG